MGLDGSWCWSWATNSLRKSSLPSSPLLPVAAWVLGSGAPEEMGGVTDMALVRWSGSGEHVDEQAAGKGDHGLDGRLGLGVGGHGAIAGRGGAAGAGLAVARGPGRAPGGAA